MARYIWRMIRPYVYSMDDYMLLVESNPGEVTYREAALLQHMSEVANG